MSKKYQHLDIEERVHIQFLLVRGFTVRAIARAVNRAPSSIARELVRNDWVRPVWPRRRGRPCIAGGDRAVQAQRRADIEIRRARKPPRLRAGSWPWEQMLLLLGMGHSPGKSPAYSDVCILATRIATSATRPFTRRSTRCRAVNCAPKRERLHARISGVRINYRVTINALNLSRASDDARDHV
jgi:hypothetical protein